VKVVAGLVLSRCNGPLMDTNRNLKIDTNERDGYLLNTCSWFPPLVEKRNDGYEPYVRTRKMKEKKKVLAYALTFKKKNLSFLATY
jgi:hypothetical protein